MPSARYLRRIIERDPFDENAQLGLVSVLEAQPASTERRAARTASTHAGWTRSTSRLRRIRGWTRLVPFKPTESPLGWTMPSVETFVVRVFVPAGRESVPFTGTIEHVGAGESSCFRGAAELIDTVMRALQLDDLSAPSELQLDVGAQAPEAS